MGRTFYTCARQVCDRSRGQFYTFSGNQIFERTAAAQTVSVTAGTTTAGYGGDGGPAINAQLIRPVSLALDRNGNLFVADRNNDVIRIVDLAVHRV